MIEIEARTVHLNERAKVDFAKYENGRTAIVLFNPETHEQLATATVNLPETQLSDDHVFVKDWSENMGMLKLLLKEGLVEDTGHRVPTGYVEAALCRLTERSLAHRDGGAREV